MVSGDTGPLKMVVEFVLIQNSLDQKTALCRVSPLACHFLCLTLQKTVFQSLPFSIFEHNLENFTSWNPSLKSWKAFGSFWTCLITSLVQFFLQKLVKFHARHYDFLLLLTFSCWKSSSLSNSINWNLTLNQLASSMEASQYLTWSKSQ